MGFAQAMQNLQPEYRPELADDIEVLLDSEYEEFTEWSQRQQDPLKMVYNFEGSEELELDEENSDRVRDLLEPYGNAEPDQREEYFEDRMELFGELDLPEDSNINYINMEPYSVRQELGSEELAVSKMRVGYDLPGQKEKAKRFWVGARENGENFMWAEKLLQDEEKGLEIPGLVYGATEPTVELSYPGSEATYTQDFREFPGLELGNVLDLSDQILSGVDKALGDKDPLYTIDESPIEPHIQQRCANKAQERKVRRKIRKREVETKHLTDPDPEKVFTKRMSGDLSPLLQIDWNGFQGSMQHRALFAGSNAVPELDENNYYGVFFGQKGGSGNQQRELEDVLSDDSELDVETFARNVLKEKGVLE